MEIEITLYIRSNGTELYLLLKVRFDKGDFEYNWLRVYSKFSLILQTDIFEEKG